MRKNQYEVIDNMPITTALDEVAEQLKDEFFEGLDFHQLMKLVRNKDKIVELLTVLP
jgi:hypothetical protein